MNNLKRTYFNQKRRRLSDKQRQQYAKWALLSLIKILKTLPKTAKIAVYHANFGELPTAPLIDFCYKNGYQLYLPVVFSPKKHTLLFAPLLAKYTSPTKFDYVKLKHTLGMNEPISRLHLPISALHACICPLVAVDKRGYRMGMGGGFYDATLAHYQGLKIGWCYDFQVVDNIPNKPWDIKMDWVVTNTKRWRC